MLRMARSRSCVQAELQGAAPFIKSAQCGCRFAAPKDARITGAGAFYLCFHRADPRQTLPSMLKARITPRAFGLPVSPRYHIVHDIEQAIAEIEQIGQEPCQTGF